MDQATALIKSLVALIEVTGATPLISLILLVLLGPWLVLVIISIFQHRRFEAVVTMYNNNFQQVEVTQGLARDYKDMADGEREMVVWATSEVSAMKAAIEGNMHCPLIRKNAKPKDINDGY
jgi:hypothetical protein